ncbi:adenine-specific methyltransferase [Listeria floridensis FSL S10-1187]|uniref:Adenine-specific methyltransferase n=1 Tax=Listeria floridensis FSL S10-1187 TaxID=1265817 RepID=A0ABN0RHC9_9LIST|nr:class I SAM-dependent methyltransferase [Listeria floridensis]EUJ33287.1 adenine-specific methyltransferase [Listeria floridensis FSL S10-1187]
MTNETTPKVFQVLDETAIILQNVLEMSYLEAVYETSENLFQNDVLQKDELTAEQVKKLEEKYQMIQLEDFSSEEIRKSFQLALLKGMKHGIQVNHQMTPDSIGFILAYLVEKAVEGKKQISVLDPAVGTGNLLTTLVNQLKLHSGDKIEVAATGVEVDDLLISLALVGSDLERVEMTLLHQDGLANLLVDPVDVVISDLPVGYYPDDNRAEDYELRREDGHSYAHFLFIEQGMRYTKPGGYLFFIVPENMFGTEDFAKLDRYIKKYGFLEGIIKLPESLFQSEKARKSILILQKNGEGVKAPKEVLLANLTSLTDPHTTAPILAQIEKWFQENKQEGN